MTGVRRATNGTARRTAATWLTAAVRPLFAAAATRPTRWPGVLAAVGAILVGTAVIVLRQPGVGALDTVWAEDGSIFLTDAVNRSPLGALATSYAGYYHLVPRLLAQFAVLFPAGAAATVLALSAAAVTAAGAVLVYVASAGQFTSRLARFLVAAIVVVLPLGQDDLPNSIANLHWTGLYALFWMLLWTPASRAGRIVAPVVVVLVAGSDILVMAFLPLALLRWWVRRDRYSALLAGLLTAALVVQVSGLLTGSSSRTLAPNPVRSLTGYLVRTVPAAVLGQRWFNGRVDLGWLLLAGFAWGLVAVVVVIVLRTRLTRPNWALAGLAALYSVGLYVLPVTLSGVATPRYAAAPAMLLVTALAALLQPAATARAMVPLWTVAAVLGVVCLANLRVDNERAHGPTWHEQLARARHTCTTSSLSTVDVLVSPVATPPWLVHLPCGYLDR